MKYHNDLNTVVMRKWTSEEMNFFFAIIAKSRNHGNSRLTFSTDELKGLTKFATVHKQRWEDTMESTIRKITQLNYIERKKGKIRAMTLFSWIEIDLEDRTLEVEVSNQFEYVLNQIQANFTSYELEEFVKIRSTYAKTAYRLLKQWRTIGKKEFSIEEFKLLMDMPDYYTPSHINRLALKPIEKELSQFFIGLKIKKVKSNTRGNPVIGFIFTWRPEQTNEWIEGKFEKKKTPKKKEVLPDWAQDNTVSPKETAVSPEKVAEFNKRLEKFRNSGL